MGYCKPSVGIILILCRSFRWMVQVRTASPSSTVFATSTTSACYVALLVCGGIFGYAGLHFQLICGIFYTIFGQLECNPLSSTSIPMSTVVFIKLLPSFLQSHCQREPKSFKSGRLFLTIWVLLIVKFLSNCHGWKPSLLNSTSVGVNS